MQNKEHGLQRGTMRSAWLKYDERGKGGHSQTEESVGQTRFVAVILRFYSLTEVDMITFSL